jgi:hypothetical protein
MEAIPNAAPTNVASISTEKGETFGIQWGGPEDITFIPFLVHEEGRSIVGADNDDLLSICQMRLEGFQSGPFACDENADALDAVVKARDLVGRMTGLTSTPNTVTAEDQPDPQAGNASHRFKIETEAGQIFIQFQHGARGLATSTPGVFDDDLLAIVEYNIVAPLHDPSHPSIPADRAVNVLHAMVAVRAARQALGRRVAVRMSKKLLGKNEQH